MGKCGCKPRIIVVPTASGGTPFAFIELEYKFGLRASWDAGNSIFPMGPDPAGAYQFEVKRAEEPDASYVIEQAFSNDPQFIHLFPSAGNYDVRLTVRDTGGSTQQYYVRENISRVLEVNNPDANTNSYIPLLSDALDYIRPVGGNPTPIGVGIGARSADDPWLVKTFGYIDQGDTLAAAFSFIHILAMPDSTTRFGDGSLICQRDVSIEGSGWGVPAFIKDSGADPNGILQSTISSPFVTTYLSISNLWVVNEINGDDELPNIVNEATAINVGTAGGTGQVSLNNVKTTSRAINTLRNSSLSVTGSNLAGSTSKVYATNCFFETIGADNGPRLINGSGLVAHHCVGISDTGADPANKPLFAVIRQGGWEFHNCNLAVTNNYRLIECRGNAPYKLYGNVLDNRNADPLLATVLGNQITSFLQWEMFGNTIIHAGAGTLAVSIQAGGPWVSARFNGNIVHGDLSGLTPVATVRDIGGNELW